MLVIDKCAYTNNLKDISATIKLTVAIAGILISMIIKNIYIHIGIVGGISFLIIFLAKIDIKIYIDCIKIPLYFLILGVFINLINISTEEVQMMYSIKFINLYLGVTYTSISNSIYLLLRSISCVVCIYFFILTTPFNELIGILKKFNISDTLTEIIILTYRFIFIFLEEFEDIYKSQQLKFGYINLKNSYRSTGLLINTLFFRMMRRYEDMNISLDMKLYNGKFHI